MPKGDCQRAFAEVASAEGLELVGQSFSWLNQQGHLGLPVEAATAVAALDEIFLSLGGDLDVLAAAPPTRLTGDFVHAPTGTLIEIDESQHFTSARLGTFDLYPEGVELGYDLGRYCALCDSWRVPADAYFRSKSARGFGEGGRQRQRAYFDALRDLASPAMGHPPLIRIAAPERDGAAAYQAHRDQLAALIDGLGSGGDRVPLS